MKNRIAKRLAGVIVMAGLLSFICAFVLIATGSVKVVRVAPPAIVHATNVFAGQPKRPVPVIDLNDTTKVQCLGYDLERMGLKVASTIVDAGDATKAACDAQEAAVRKASDEHIAALERQMRAEKSRNKK